MTTKTHNIRPAGQGFNCDAWNENPNPEEGPYLIRCRCRATRRMVLQNYGDPYTIKRCPAHAQELRDKEARGAAFEILSDEAIQCHS